MRVFIASYGWTPEGTEAIVFCAEDVEAARDFLVADHKSVVFIDDDETGNDPNKCHLEEIDITISGEIYRGSYCC